MALQQRPFLQRRPNPFHRIIERSLTFGLNIIDGSMDSGNVRKSVMEGYTSVGVQLLVVDQVSPRGPLQTYVVGFCCAYLIPINDCHYMMQPVSYTSLGLTMLTGAGLWWYFKSVEKQRMEKIAQKGAKNAVVAGKADIGGDFELIDSRNGKTFHSDALKGGFSLLYFGFTHCPDVCPDELEKIASAIDLVDEEMKGSTFKPVTPVFITLDPERDGVKQVAAYVKEFHPRMIGLTGSTESITKVTKSYRVYFTKAGVGEMTNNTSNTKDDDYLIDHSIITYLLDPKGEFVTFYGKNYTDRAMADSMLSIIKSYSG